MRCHKSYNTTRLPLTLLLAALVCGCSTTRNVVQDLELQSSDEIVPFVALQKPLGDRLFLTGSVRGFSGSDSHTLRLRGFTPATAASGLTPSRPASPAEEFRYGNLLVTGNTDPAEEGGSRSRDFSADYSYRAADVGLLWSAYDSQRGRIDAGLLVRYDQLAIDVTETLPVISDTQPLHFSVDESAIAVGAVASAALLLSKPLQIRLRTEFSQAALSDVERLGFDLSLIYRVNQRFGLEGGFFSFSRSDRREVSPIDLKATGLQIGLAVHL